MRYLSVCSGIEAATAAWHPLGWEPVGFAEIEPFPSAVLAHHYPSVPNFGDFTTIEADDAGSIDLLVGGTPCQSFSVAGLRGGLDDDRGNLALEYLRLADRTRPRWLVWENVPGVLSSNGGRDFGSILGGMGELGYGWAYRVLDAQYIRVDGYARAVPQRRRRVFVVGYLGDWRRAAAVLFERESLSGHPAPRRKAGQRPAPTISARPTGGGGLGTDFDCDGGLIADTVARCLNADAQGRIDGESETFVVSGHGDYRPGLPSLRAQGGDVSHGSEALVTHALRAEGFDASEDGTGWGTPIVPISFDCKAGANTGFAVGEIPGALRGEGHGGGHAAVAFAENSRAELRLCGGDGTVAAQLTTGGGKPGQGQPCVAFDMRGREGGAQFEGPHATANIRAASGGSSRSYVAEAWAVRRLTPIECERLMGFPDGYTAIPYRVKPAADGPRYKALGNSMAVNVMRWIGRRIEQVEQINGHDHQGLQDRQGREAKADPEAEERIGQDRRPETPAPSL